MMRVAMVTPANFILYDGKCPVCSNYVAWTNLRSVRPDIELIDARKAHNDTPRANAAVRAS
jgi:predicted DCC family thiol-disulfide oxidoreductase YuxK